MAFANVLYWEGGWPAQGTAGKAVLLEQRELGSMMDEKTQRGT